MNQESSSLVRSNLDRGPESMSSRNHQESHTAVQILDHGPDMVQNLDSTAIPYGDYRNIMTITHTGHHCPELGGIRTQSGQCPDRVQNSSTEPNSDSDSAQMSQSQAGIQSVSNTYHGFGGHSPSVTMSRRGVPRPLGRRYSSHTTTYQ